MTRFDTAWNYASWLIDSKAYILQLNTVCLETSNGNANCDKDYHDRDFARGPVKRLSCLITSLCIIVTQLPAH